MIDMLWNERLEFLKAIRTGWCNNDYIEFLVEKVWKINKPVNVVDFGCGFGYVGLLLLPILPKGSTYTGIDFSKTLLTEAESIFKNMGYSARFIEADLINYEPDKIYDIAVSQAVLRHIPKAKNVLKKMIESVKKGGLVICMESDLEIEKTAQYFDGFDYTDLDLPTFHRKMYKSELQDGGRDYRIGIKIPVLMQKFGLNNVDVRMNDCVKFINPYGDKSQHDEQYNAIIKAWGWDRQWTEDFRSQNIDWLIKNGLSEKDAVVFQEGQIIISQYVMEHKDSAFLLQAPGTFISYGTK